MKTVFFIRHAKSSWGDINLTDIQRPLNKRGERDAPFMAKVLRGKKAEIDQFISSPAVRAFTTATYFVNEFGQTKDMVRSETFIYHSYMPQILDFVNQLENSLNTVCIFGHNPTMTSLANHFSKEFIPNVPTCGILRVESSVDNWDNFSADNAQLTAFYFPKQYFE